MTEKTTLETCSGVVTTKSAGKPLFSVVVFLLFFFRLRVDRRPNRITFSVVCAFLASTR